MGYSLTSNPAIRMVKTDHQLSSMVLQLFFDVTPSCFVSIFSPCHRIFLQSTQGRIKGQRVKAKGTWRELHRDRESQFVDTAIDVSCEGWRNGDHDCRSSGERAVQLSHRERKLKGKQSTETFKVNSGGFVY
ncbi:hypothetical protein RRG08_019135 [Elysia crispata]|uniref:Uncharacterized protein n=1 Tax=Elysia crispata TaxID=231223 RepID=A0AAE0YVZ6_9GAST|nr:hypothetical protein RRG08_019135 [Elysia crispata]